jgi:hypothetical protein
MQLQDHTYRPAAFVVSQRRPAADRGSNRASHDTPCRPRRGPREDAAVDFALRRLVSPGSRSCQASASWETSDVEIGRHVRPSDGGMFSVQPLQPIDRIPNRPEHARRGGRSPAEFDDSLIHHAERDHEL